MRVVEVGKLKASLGYYIRMEHRIADVIDSLEMIDCAPLREGEWRTVHICGEVKKRCSLCGYQIDAFAKKEDNRFCSRCGAKMI